MLVHAGVLCQLHVLGKGICRHGNDGHFAPAAGKGTDRSSGFVTIHDGHLDVHKNEIVPLFWRFHHLFDCNFSVFGNVNGHARHAYDLGCDLTVQLVIFHKKDPLTRIVFLRKVFQIVPGVFLLLPGCKLPQSCRQTGTEQRFCHKRIHARCSGFFFDLAEIKGSQDDDRDIFSYPFPDFSGGCNTVHFRHLPVQDHRKIVTVGLMTRIAALHSFLTGQDPFARYADLLKGRNGAFAAGLVIVHDQYRQIEQFFFLFLLVLLKLQIDRDRDLRSLVGSAFDLNVTIHQVDDVSCNGHAKTGALHLGRPVIVCPAERLEHDLLEFRRHTDAVVLDGKLVAAKLREAVRFFLDRKGDVSSIRGVLDGVAHQVHKDLLDAQAVAADSFVLNVLNMDFELMVVLVDCRFCEGEQVIDQLRQAEILLGKAYSPALDSGHIQHFIDQSQQMTARLCDLAKALDHPVLTLDIRTRNGGQANDCIHRCTDIMGHIGEKFRLGAACVFRRPVRILQCLMGFDLGLFLL